MPLSQPLRQHEPMVSNARRRGVFPGSFNPLTIAHLEIARQARETHALDEVTLAVSAIALDKPAPPGPPLAERIDLIEADIADESWLRVVATDLQLIADIAAGFDVVIMGADKWHQVNDAKYYSSPAERDEAVSRLPEVVVAPRTGSTAPEHLRLDTDAEIHGVSSTDARNGRRDLMAPNAARLWVDE